MRDNKERKGRGRHGRLADEAAALLREFDADGALVTCNEAWLAFTGTGLEQELGQSWYERVHPADRERCEQALAQAARRTAPFVLEYRLRRHDGTHVHVIDSGAPVAGGDGGFVSSALDVGALDAEVAGGGVPDALTLQELLLDAERRRDQFVGALAHELRNPLTPILNALHLLKTPRLTEGDARQAHEMIERQCLLLLRLIDDLLDLSRSKQGRVLLRHERVDLGQVARQAVESSRSAFQDAGHRCPVELPVKPLWVDADSARLAQALTHLLVIAARHTPRGGRIELRGSAHGTQAQIEIVDTGAGLAREMLPRVFEPFVPVHGPTGSPAGMGLGAALAKQLIDLQGGELSVRSDGLGKGTVFTLKMPLKPEPAAAAGRPLGRNGGARRVLVVDDNRDAARIMSLVLTSMGHEVRTAYDGHGALDVAQAFQPDTVLLDIGLPTLDGCTVGEQLRKGPHGKNLLLIALTGWGNDADRLRTRAAGFDHHLVKPVDTEVLRRLLGAAPDAAA